MRNFGWLVLLVGVLWVFFALNIDTSVPTGYGSRVNNLGLMADKQNHLMIGGFVVLCGILMAIFGGKKSQKEAIPEANGYVSCPFCAEPVRAEAIKCKHCGSDITPRKESGQTSASDLVKYGLKNELILDEISIEELAKKFNSEMPKHSPLAVMVTKAPEINSLKSFMPEAMGQRFELLLEEELKKIKS